MRFRGDVGNFRATIKVTGFNVVQEKDDALFVICEMVDSLNELVVGGLAWVLSFGFGVENIQNQNNGIG